MFVKKVKIDIFIINATKIFLIKTFVKLKTWKLWLALLILHFSKFWISLLHCNYVFYSLDVRTDDNSIIIFFLHH